VYSGLEADNLHMGSSQTVLSPVEQDKTASQLAVDLAQEFANYRRLVERVGDVFGDATKASLWLSMPNADLGGETPLQRAEKDGYSGQSLEPILVRIEHGIYY
jgi:uncharacterized protein (DUF2384 family)